MRGHQSDIPPTILLPVRAKSAKVVCRLLPELDRGVKRGGITGDTCLDLTETPAGTDRSRDRGLTGPGICKTNTRTSGPPRCKISVL